MDQLISSPLMTNVFGKTADISSVVKSFDFSRMDARDETSKNYLHTELAPSLGKLNADYLRDMDDNLKIMIAGTLKVLGAQTDKSWDAVMATMMQNPLLEPDGAEIAKSDKLIKESASAFKFDGSPDATIVKEVHSWFTSLIGDSDVLDSTQIDINVLAEIVAQTGATVEDFETFFAKREHHEKTMVDIGVLRFPDIDHPHFKLYRIQLVAWSDSDRVLMFQNDQNGITGDYRSRNFKPRASVIDQMSKATREKAVAAAESLFS